jgi:ferredoxin-NADP reductase
MTMKVWVHTLRFEAQNIISVDLRPMAGQKLVPFQPGSHIDLHLPGNLIRSYSLANDSQETHRYLLGILKEKSSRGGSVYVHEQLRVGMQLTISEPRNNFPLSEEADHSVLIAGGIGVTPILSMAKRLQALGKSFEILALGRSRNAFAFADDIAELKCPVHWHFDDASNGPPNLHDLLQARPPKGNVHYYACGPAAMLDAFETVCQTLGYAHHHIERFAAVEVKAADDARQSFIVELRKSGKTFEVTPDTNLHQQLIQRKINVPFSCEEGICGACETQVLEGIPDHRDMVLSSAEQASNRVMMVCVSGCKSERLVLNL